MEIVYKEKVNSSVTFSRMLRLAVPVLLSMFSLNVMVFVDRAFVAKYDLVQFAATLPASNLATSFANLFIGLIGFASVLISQYYGAGQYGKCALSMWQGVYLSFLFSAILLVSAPGVSGIFGLMGHSGELLQHEKHFFYLMILSSCAQLFVTAFSGIYRGIGSTMTILVVGVFVNILNILLDWLLIFGRGGLPELGGIAGSGFATLISTAAGAITYIGLLNRAKMKEKYGIFSHVKINKDLIFKLLRFGLPAGVQTFAGSGYFTLLLLFVGKTGELNLSAANIAFTIEGISIIPVWGLGAAVSIIAGQEKGAGRADQVGEALKKGLLVGLVINLAIIAVYNLFPRELISLFGAGEQSQMFDRVMDLTLPLIRITSLWIVFDTLQIVVGNVLRAMGDTVFMMTISLVVPILFYALFPYFLTRIDWIPLYWVWLDLLLYTFVMLGLVFFRYLEGKWKRMELI
ncbi:MATE family efflux transporter [Paenibacillus caui]|uniref:MATE family efflux transporter n=1 Tax=Paenibacillus caui TaxID=2873927 RepID=UPI001CA8AC09|nr:MATE family efflux transporter [Paenibacillus caui]